ncbi:MAG: hypothetical protein ACSHXY_03495 [Alphaproteobacteria bacterium]
MTYILPPQPERIPTFAEAIEIHKMIKAGCKQSQIAAHFGTNQGRISEINTGKRHNGSYHIAFG